MQMVINCSFEIKYFTLYLCCFPLEVFILDVAGRFILGYCAAIELMDVKIFKLLQDNIKTNKCVNMRVDYPLLHRET